MNSPDTKIINNYLSADFSGSWGNSDPGAGGPRFGIAIEAGLSGGEVSGNVIGGPNSWASGVAASQQNTLVKNNQFYGKALWGDTTGEPGNNGNGSVVEQNNLHTGDRSKMPGVPKLGTVIAPPVNTGNSGGNSGGNGSSGSTSKPASGSGFSGTYISDLTWDSATNGWGDVELNKSLGNDGTGDGSTLSVEGTKYSHGLGVGINSEVDYSLNGKYKSFLTDVGIDDEVNHKGSMTFQIWVDGKLAYDSGVMTGNDAAKTAQVNVLGAKSLKLITTSAGDGGNSDHGDWGNARLTS
jgi:NPCBM/NEW2 domain